jgi:flagellar hook-associated protein 2
VAAVFASAATPSDSQVAFNASSSSTKAGSYEVNITQLASQGVVNGASVLPADFFAAPLVINSSNDSLTIKLDGISSNEVLIPLGSYNNGDTLAAVIQSQINADTALSAAGTSVVVTYDSANNRFDVTSARYGSASKVEFINVDTSSAADLGFAAGPGTDGVDVAGTINGLSATGNGQKLSSDLGDSNGLSLNITGGTTGARGTVDFSTGFVNALGRQMDSLLADNGLIDARENGLQSSIDDLGEQRTTLNSRMVTYEARLVAQFSAMDALVASLQTTGNFLSSQLANLPGAISLNRNR